MGHSWPDTGKALKPLGDLFINLVKMIIAPIIFCTIVHGIASMSDMKKLGRIGIKTLLYFLIVGASVEGFAQPETARRAFGLDLSTPESIDRYATAVIEVLMRGILA